MQSKKYREQIIKLFLHNESLTFADIEKQLKVRSNMLAYILDTLQKEQIIEKKVRTYRLTAQQEQLLPFIAESLHPLPVILVALTHNRRVGFYMRKKRPYNNLYSLIGGRLKIGESIETAAIRLTKKLAHIDVNKVKTHHIMHESVGDPVKHSFILFFCSANITKEQKDASQLEWFLPNTLPKNIIPSDALLVQKALTKKLTISRLSMSENFSLLHHNL